MGEVEKNALLFWCQKIVNDESLLAQDPRGKKIGEPEFVLNPGENLTTFCNIGVQRICRGVAYTKLDDMTADQMHDYMEKNWIIPYGTPKDKMLAAYNASKIGDIAILSYKHNPHGHVAVCAPSGPMIFSGKWDLYSPQVANIGGMMKDGSTANGFKGANFAFTEIPDVFLLGRTIA